MKFVPGEWIQVEDVMKYHEVNRLKALKIITGMQADGVLGRFVYGKGYPAPYGN